MSTEKSSDKTLEKINGLIDSYDNTVKNYFKKIDDLQNVIYNHQSSMALLIDDKYKLHSLLLSLESELLAHKIQLNKIKEFLEDVFNIKFVNVPVQSDGDTSFKQVEKSNVNMLIEKSEEVYLDSDGKVKTLEQKTIYDIIILLLAEYANVIEEKKHDDDSDSDED